MKKLLCLLMTVWLMPGYSQTQATKTSFSLQEAQEYALQNGYSVTDKRLEYEKARKTIKETAAAGLPQITADAQYTYNAKILGQPVPANLFDPNAPEDKIAYAPFGVPHQTRANLSLNQLIFDGSYFVALQATQVVKDIASLDIQKAEIDIRTDVANAYYGVLVTREAREIAQENLKVIEENYRETKALYENGFLEEQDADQLELLMNNLSNNVRNFSRQEELAYQLLKFYMGLPLETEVSLTSTVDELSALNNSETVLLTDQFLLENHIDYRIAQNNLRAASLQLKNEKAGYLPSLSFFALHSQLNADNNDFNAFSYDRFWADGTSLGLNLNWTLFSGLARPAKVQKAKIDVQRTQLAITITQSQLQLAYEQAKSDYQFAVDNYNTQKKNVVISQKIRDRTLIKFKEGLSSSLELTQAENQLLTAQSDYLNAMQSLLTAKENVQKAIGKL